MVTDNCAPRTRRRKYWYRKKASRRNVKRWLFHPGKNFRRKLPLWMPGTKKRGLKSWQRPFLLFAIFVDLIAKIVQWLLDLLGEREKRNKPRVPIPIPKPAMPDMPMPIWPRGGGRGGRRGCDDCIKCLTMCIRWCRGFCCGDNCCGYG